MIGSRVVVTGGRDFDDRDFVFASLDRINAGPRGPIAFLAEGGASGADQYAREWARLRSIGGSTHYADWKQHGRAAGPRRNRDMLVVVKPDLLVAFPGGVGTNDCIGQAQRMGIVVVPCIPDFIVAAWGAR